VAVGVDEDGDVVDSCVVVETAVPAMGKVGKGGKKLGPWEQLVYEVVSEIGLAQNTMDMTEVLDEVIERKAKPEPGKRDTRRQHAKRALMALCEGDGAPFYLEDGCITIL